MSDFIRSALIHGALPSAALVGTVLVSGCGLSVLHGLTGDADAGQDMKDAGTPDAGPGDAGSDSGVCVPPSPPTTYKRVFVTSKALPNSLGTLDDLDAYCKLLADQSCLGGNWKVWLSDNLSGPASRFNHASVPYKRLDTNKVADDWSDLTDGTLDNPISVTELGKLLSSGLVWTATTPAGTPFDKTCNDWQSAASTDVAKVGNSVTAGSDWTHNVDAPCSGKFRLYCFEQ